MDDNKYPIYQRYISDSIAIALADTPVVMLIGPRQCGKSTLVRQLVDGNREYITLDDSTVLGAARSDPAGFVRGLDRATIDEVQRAPELLRAIKKSVDEDRRPGRFLLTGSANVLTLPQVSESLAGRMEIVSLLPIARAEIENKKPVFLESAFAGALLKPEAFVIGEELLNAVLVGGYPEMIRRESPRRRQAWARDYTKAIVERDVRDIAEIEKRDQMPRLLQVLAHHSGQLTNFTQIGGQIGIDDKTTRKYVGILEQLFLVHRVSPWFHNELKRLIKTPKLHFVDSGLLAALLGVNADQVAKDRSCFGSLLETFIVSEVMKEMTWSDQRYALHHYRDKDQDEVDLVIENERGALVGIEVKASATVHTSDFRGLRKLLDSSGDDMKMGIVLYDGETIVPFGNRLFAAPISCVWS